MFASYDIYRGYNASVYYILEPLEQQVMVMKRRKHN